MPGPSNRFAKKKRKAAIAASIRAASVDTTATSDGGGGKRQSSHAAKTKSTTTEAWLEEQQDDNMEDDINSAGTDPDHDSSEDRYYSPEPGLGQRFGVRAGAIWDRGSTNPGASVKANWNNVTTSSCGSRNHEPFVIATTFGMGLDSSIQASREFRYDYSQGQQERQHHRETQHHLAEQADSNLRCSYSPYQYPHQDHHFNHEQQTGHRSRQRHEMRQGMEDGGHDHGRQHEREQSHDHDYQYHHVDSYPSSSPSSFDASFAESRSHSQRSLYAHSHSPSHTPMNLVAVQSSISYPQHPQQQHQYSRNAPLEIPPDSPISLAPPASSLPPPPPAPKGSRSTGIIKRKSRISGITDSAIDDDGVQQRTPSLSDLHSGSWEANTLVTGSDRGHGTRLTIDGDFKFSFTHGKGDGNAKSNRTTAVDGGRGAGAGGGHDAQGHHRTGGNDAVDHCSGSPQKANSNNNNNCNSSSTAADRSDRCQQAQASAKPEETLSMVSPSTLVGSPSSGKSLLRGRVLVRRIIHVPGYEHRHGSTSSSQQGVNESSGAIGSRERRGSIGEQQQQTPLHRQTSNRRWNREHDQHRVPLAVSMTPLLMRNPVGGGHSNSTSSPATSHILTPSPPLNTHSPLSIRGSSIATDFFIANEDDVVGEDGTSDIYGGGTTSGDEARITKVLAAAGSSGSRKERTLMSPAHYQQSIRFGDRPCVESGCDPADLDRNQRQQEQLEEEEEQDQNNGETATNHASKWLERMGLLRTTPPANPSRSQDAAGIRLPPISAILSQAQDDDSLQWPEPPPPPIPYLYTFEDSSLDGRDDGEEQETSANRMDSGSKPRRSLPVPDRQQNRSTTHTSSSYHSATSGGYSRPGSRSRTRPRKKHRSPSSDSTSQHYDRYSPQHRAHSPAPSVPYSASPSRSRSRSYSYSESYDSRSRTSLTRNSHSSCSSDDTRSRSKSNGSAQQQKQKQKTYEKAASASGSSTTASEDWYDTSDSRKAHPRHVNFNLNGDDDYVDGIWRRDPATGEYIDPKEMQVIEMITPCLHDPGNGPRVKNIYRFLNSYFVIPPAYNVPLCAEFAQPEMLEMLCTVLPEETALIIWYNKSRIKSRICPACRRLYDVGARLKSLAPNPSGDDSDVQSDPGSEEDEDEDENDNEDGSSTSGTRYRTSKKWRREIPPTLKREQELSGLCSPICFIFALFNNPMAIKPAWGRTAYEMDQYAWELLNGPGEGILSGGKSLLGGSFPPGPLGGAYDFGVGKVLSLLVRMTRLTDLGLGQLCLGEDLDLEGDKERLRSGATKVEEHDVDEEPLTARPMLSPKQKAPAKVQKSPDQSRERSGSTGSQDDEAGIYAGLSSWL